MHLKELYAVPFTLTKWPSRLSIHEERDQGPWFRDSTGKTPPCTLMAPGPCKIHCGSNVLQIPIQVIPLGVPKRGRHPLHGGSKL